MQNEGSLPFNNAATSAENGKDQELWQIAKRRSAFKISAFTYVAVNMMLVAIWYFSTGYGSYFWPFWPMLGWGIGIATQYFHAYHGSNLFSTQREYEKLKNKQSN